MRRVFDKIVELTGWDRFYVAIVLMELIAMLAVIIYARTYPCGVESCDYFGWR